MPEPVSESPAYIAAEVRRQDHDRYLTALFAPAEVRPAVLAAYAFNAELAHVPETVSEPLMGEIRLQWWRDAIAAMAGDEAVPRHPTAVVLAKEVRAGRLGAEGLTALVDARVPEVYGEVPATMPDLEERLAGTAGDLAVNVLEASMSRGDSAVGDWREAARHAGTAWGLVSVLRSVPRHAAQNRLFLPRDRLDAHGLRTRDLVGPAMSDATRAIVAEVADRARTHITAARRAGRPPRQALHVFLSATLAACYLKMLERENLDIFRNVGERGAAGRMSRLFLAALSRKF